MRHTGTVWLGIIVGCALLLSGCGAAGPAAESAAQAQPPTATPMPTPTSSATPAPTPTSSATPVPTATPVPPTPTATPVPLGAVGERLERANIALTVRSVELASEVGALRAVPGEVFVIVEVLVENHSQTRLDDASLFHFVDIPPVRYFPTGPEWLQKVPLQPGEQMQGKIALRVAANASNLVLEFAPHLFAARLIAPIRVALGDVAALREGVAALPQDSPAPTPAATMPTPEAAAPTLAAAQPTRMLRVPAPGVPIGVVVNGGNLRTLPDITSSEVLGQVCPDDQVQFLEQHDLWYRIEIYALGADCVPDRAALGTKGWVSGLLLSSPSAAVPNATTPPQEPPPLLGVAVVNQMGTLRSEPRIASDTSMGEVCSGDSVELLEQHETNAMAWYRVRLGVLAADCAPQRVQADTEGWLSSALLAFP